MAVQINGQDVGPIKFTDNLAGRTIHVGQASPVNPVDGDIWIDADALNNAGKNLIQTIDLTSGSSKNCAVSSDYKDVEIIIRGLNISANAALSVRVNGDLTSSYIDSAGVPQTSLFTLDSVKAGVTTNHVKISVVDVNSLATSKTGDARAVYTSSSTNLSRLFLSWGAYTPATISPITAITLTLTTGTFVSGTVLVYGVN